MKIGKDENLNESRGWFCEHCGEQNPSDALICESCGKSISMDSYPASTMNSRKYEHEEFRKRFWKFKQQHPDLVKKFTQILKEQMEMMISPSRDVKFDDNDVPDISAEEIIRMSMALGMSSDEVLDMMIEQSEDYD